MMYSLTEAARQTGVSKSTIYRAVKSGKISAKRNEDAEYEIDPAELFRVFEQQVIHSEPTQKHEMNRTELPQNEASTDVAAIQKQMEWFMTLAEQQREQLQETQEKWFEALQLKDREMKVRDEYWQQQINDMKQLLLAAPERRKKFLGIF